MQTAITTEIQDLTDEYRWYLLQKKHHEINIGRAFERFRAEGVEPIMIKGWATARFYPPGRARFYADIDMAVSHDSFETAKKLCAIEEVKALNIDLHDEFRHLDSLSWDVLYQNSNLVMLEGTQIRILSAEDHLRIVCIHWLGDGGAFKEKLWDIYYAVENRPANFDWHASIYIISETRRKWIITAIGLAHKYLGLCIDGLPFAEEAKKIPSWIERTVEKEWASEIRLRPLQTCLHDRKLLFRQLFKRIPPNPIQATIEMEGRFDNSSRLHYQVGSVFNRFLPSLRRISNALKRYSN